MFKIIVIALVFLAGLSSAESNAGYAMYVWREGYDSTVESCTEDDYKKWDTRDKTCFTHSWNTVEKRTWLWNTCNVPGREITRLYLNDVETGMKKAYSDKSCSMPEVNLLRQTLADGHWKVADLKIFALFADGAEEVTEKEKVKYVVYYNDNCAESDIEKFDGVAVNNEEYRRVKCPTDENGKLHSNSSRTDHLDSLYVIKTEAQKQKCGKLLTHFSIGWHWGTCNNVEYDITWNNVTQMATYHMIDIFDSTDVQVAYITADEIKRRIEFAGLGHAKVQGKEMFANMYLNKEACASTFFEIDNCVNDPMPGKHTESGLWEVVDQFSENFKPCLHYFRGAYSSGGSDGWPVHNNSRHVYSVWCPDGWVSHRGSCYYVNTVVSSEFTAAEDYCENQGGYLVEITSQEEWQFLSTYLKPYKNIDFWSGGRRNTGEGTWNWSGSQDEVTYFNWAPGQPQTDPGHDCLALMTGDVYEYHDVFCSDTYSPVCEMRPLQSQAYRAEWVTAELSEVYSGCCPDGWVVYRGSCYLFDNTAKVQFTDAEDRCRQQGGQLVEINCKDEWEFVSNFLKPYKYLNVWTGGSDSAVEGSWRWVGSNKSITYFNWSPYQPQNTTGEDCLALMVNYGYQYHDAFCTDLYNPMCEIRGGYSSEYTEPGSVVSNHGCCPDGWVYHADTCYLFTNTTVPFMSAEATCKHMDARSHLVEIDTQDEWTFLSNFLTPYRDNHFWTGGCKIGSEWLWIGSRTPVTYFNWYPGQPQGYYNEDCLVLWAYNQHQYHDAFCNQHYNPLCEMRPEL